jgi:hypothetical protein
MVDDLPLLKLSLVDPSKGNQNDEWTTEGVKGKLAHVL